jgi:putative membrane protein
MSTETVVQKAAFDPKVCRYWIVSGTVVLTCTLIGIPFLLLWIPLGLLFTGRYLDRMECILTNKTLIVRKGILTRTEKTIPLEKITDLGMVQGPIMRLFSITTLSIETAGQSGPGSLVSLTGIVGAAEFREAVLAQRDTLAGQASPEESTTASSEGAVLSDIRDTLLRIEKQLAAQQRD